MQIPPRETVKVHYVTLKTFKEVKPEPFTDAEPMVILEVFKDVKPEPFTDNVPVVILEAFKEVNEAPEPTKLEADKVFGVLFHVKFENSTSCIMLESIALNKGAQC